MLATAEKSGQAMTLSRETSGKRPPIFWINSSWPFFCTFNHNHLPIVVFSSPPLLDRYLLLKWVWIPRKDEKGGSVLCNDAHEGSKGQ